MTRMIFFLLTAAMFFAVETKGQEPEITAPIPGDYLDEFQTFTFSYFGNNFKASLQKYQYQLLIGESAPGSSDLYFNGDCQFEEVSISIPTEGRTLYVRLRYRERGKSWSHKDYTYKTPNVKRKSSIIFPKSNSQLSGAEVTFEIKRKPGPAMSHFFYVGTTGKGSKDIFESSLNPLDGTTVTIKNLPTNGETIYVRLTESCLMGSEFTDYEFTAYADKADMQTPISRAVLNTPQATFTWDKRSGQEFDITVGSSGAGSDDIKQKGTPTTGNTMTVDLSKAGTNKVYVRLWTKMSNGKWFYNDYEYSIDTPAGADITTSSSPANGGTVTGEGKYDLGLMVDMEATPAKDFVFVNWTEKGKEVSTDTKYRFMADRNRTLVANFQLKSFDYAVSSMPINGGTIAGQGKYNYGQTVNLKATSTPGYDFVNWTENGKEISTDAKYSFTADGNRTLVANFKLKNVKIEAYPNPKDGGSVSGQGSFPFGTAIELTATSKDGYRFLNWTENGEEISTNTKYSFRVDRNRTLVANFVEHSSNFEITTESSPANGGTVTGGGRYDLGLVVNLEATPAKSFVFVNWTENGKEVSTDAKYKFMADRNRTLVANFELKKVIIEADPNSNDAGNVSGQGSFSFGTEVELIAVPNDGHQFYNWTENGVEVSKDATLAITATADRKFVANFTRPTGIDTDYGSNKVSVFPNPTSSYLNIKLGKLSDSTQLYLLDNSGKKVRLNATDIGSNVLQVNIEGYTVGVYFLQIVDKTSVKTVQVVLTE